MGEHLNSGGIFPYQTRDALMYSMRFDRDGTGLLTVNHKPIEVEALGARIAGTLALLMQAAMDDSSSGDRANAHGFRTKWELYLLLKARLRRFDPAAAAELDPQEIVRYICRLRAALSALADPITGIPRWGHRFIEYRPSHGYRVSTPPENLRLEITEDSPPGEAEEHTGNRRGIALE